MENIKNPTSNKPKIRLIRLNEVLSRTGYGRTSIYRKMDEGTFPKSLKSDTLPQPSHIFLIYHFKSDRKVLKKNCNKFIILGCFKISCAYPVTLDSLLRVSFSKI